MVTSRRKAARPQLLNNGKLPAEMDLFLIKTGKLKAETYFTIQFGQATIQNICLMPKADNKCLSANGTVKAPRNRYKKTKLIPENLPKKQRGNEFSYNEN